MHSLQRVTVCLMALAALAAAGCGPAPRSVERCLAEGYIYYLDGSGGGSAFVNWSWGVKRGLEDAGYDTYGEMFSWETGLGPLADQTSGVDYKRDKAKRLAELIVEHQQACPEQVYLVALSAGSAIAVYTLEALPADAQVENVVLLGASVSSEHDLTAALRHVRGKLFVFTSPADGVLGFLVPLTGTADHEPGEPAGLAGFNLPHSASAETRRLYAEKVAPVRWTPAFEQVGNHGSHLDSVSPDFVRDYVAPLVMEGHMPNLLQKTAAKESRLPLRAGGPAAATK
jgi:pimeloyl-ACP methyl ester carboxylesterase